MARWHQAAARLGTETLEPIGAIRPRITERTRAGDQLGNEASGRGAKRQPPVGVTEGEPQALVALASPDHRDHIGKAGPPAHPWRRLQPLSERKQFAGERLVATEL